MTPCAGRSPKNRDGQGTVAGKKLEMLRKSIAALTATLMIAAITTVSAFALVSPNIFFSNEFGTPAPYGFIQVAATSAVNDDGNVTVVFSDGPYLSHDEENPGYYVAVISLGTGTAAGADITAPSDLEQTLTFVQADDETYVPITFDVTMNPTDENGDPIPDDPRQPVEHPEQALYLNVQPTE
jgi:hypothetical protein